MTVKSSLSPRSIAVAIIGSGPSGCFTAQFLRKELPEAEISIFEALPVPYGLVRYGVAADHQGTKAVTRQFDRMFERGNVNFVGNIRVGVDVEFDRIAEAFDIVVLATGLPADRALPVPCDAPARIVGAGEVIRTLNAFPQDVSLRRRLALGHLGREITVVGHGNVAIDVVRLLTKDLEHFNGTDIHDPALKTLRPAPPRLIRIVGRSSASNAKFDLAMVRELCQLDSVTIAAEGLDDKMEGPVAELLRETELKHASLPAAEASGRTAVVFHFESVPAAVRYSAGYTVLDVTDTSGRVRSFAAETVVSAIGFCQAEAKGYEGPAWSGLGTRIYSVGWLNSGGRGNIAENRQHAREVTQTIVQDLVARPLSQSEAGGLKIISSRLSSPPVDFSGWQAIDAVERSTAAADRCRRKITDLSEMVAIARTEQSVDNGLPGLALAGGETKKENEL